MAGLHRTLAGAVALVWLGAAACAGDGGPDGDPEPPFPVPAAFEPSEQQMRRLLDRHYRNTIASVFGDAAAAAADPPPESSLNGFEAIASAQFAMTDALVSRYEASARKVAEVAMADRDRIHQRMGCEPFGPGDADCFRMFIRNTGRLMFRRQVTDEELSDYLDLAETAANQAGDAYAGVQWVITAMLQSPNFLYLAEVGEDVPDMPDRRLLTGYEIASRMAFFLLDTAPDDALLAAAEAGALDTREGVREAARQLVDSDAARRATRSFFEEYLILGAMESVDKNPDMFPTFSKELAASMKEETLKLINDVVYDRDVSVMEMFSADYSFVDDNLAAHYGVAAPYQADWTKMSFPIEQRRRGIMGHASIASAQAHPDSTSVTHRGLFVIERFLCQTMPPPPDDVVPELPPSSVAPTMRERVAVHLEDPMCATCHSATDPIGLALENLDPVGRWRDRENQVTIDASAEHPQLGSFEGVDGLGLALAASPRVSACLTRQLYRYATGHVETDGEMAALDNLHARFAEAGYRFKELLVELVASDAYRYIGTPTMEEEEASP